MQTLLLILFLAIPLCNCSKNNFAKVLGHRHLKAHNFPDSIVSLSVSNTYELDTNHTVIICGSSSHPLPPRIYGLQILSAHLIEEQGEICYISYGPPTSLRNIDSVVFTIEKFPATVKIHESVLNFISLRGIFPKRSLLMLESDESSSTGKDYGEGQALVIQFAHTYDIEHIKSKFSTVQDAFQSIIKTWLYDESAESVGSQGLPEGHKPVLEGILTDTELGGGAWHSLRNRALASAADWRCVLPPSSHVEYEGDFVRLVDLSEFTGGGAGCLARLVEVAAKDHRVLGVTVEERPVLLNYAARGVLQSGTAGNEPFTAAGLTGAGEIVGVADSGLNDLSCFFYDSSGKYTSDQTTRSTADNIISEPNRRKVVQYVGNADNTDDVGGHGTHICGAIAGKSLDDNFRIANGVAPDAKIAFFDLQVTGASYVTVPDLYQYVFSSPYEAGARILSNSWGGSTSFYSSRAYATDKFAADHDDVLLVFAAGNIGSEKGKGSVYDPCLSKNALCVGSTNLRDDFDDSGVQELEVSYFSCLGPTYDGRIKPDVVAPGFKIISALSGSSTLVNSCAVAEMQGTSISAPLVAGLAVIARSYFTKTWPKLCRSMYTFCRSFTPTGYLLKAIMIHSTRPVSKYNTNSKEFKSVVDSVTLEFPPDIYQGYGQVTLSTVLPLSAKADFDLFVYDELIVAAKDIKEFQVLVLEKSPLKVTLTWYDPPSALGTASNLLVNNLDLIVTDDNGNRWNGNGAYDSSSGKGDGVHPQEQVYLPQATPGLYYVYIIGGAFPNTKYQSAGLVITLSGVVQSGPVSANLRAGTVMPPEPLETQYNGKMATYTPTVSKSFTISQVLTANRAYCLLPFNIDDNLRLTSVKIYFYSSEIVGNDVYLLSIILTSPSGLVVQLGGRKSWIQTDNIWSRTWPVLWAENVATNIGIPWVASRDLDALGLVEAGEWQLCVEPLNPDWSSKHFNGYVTVNFRDNSHHNSNNMMRLARAIDNNAIFLIAAVGPSALIIAYIAYIVAQQRKQKTDLTILAIIYGFFLGIYMVLSYPFRKLWECIRQSSNENEVETVSLYDEVEHSREESNGVSSPSTMERSASSATNQKQLRSQMTTMPVSAGVASAGFLGGLIQGITRIFSGPSHSAAKGYEEVELQGSGGNDTSSKQDIYFSSQHSNASLPSSIDPSSPSRHEVDYGSEGLVADSNSVNPFSADKNLLNKSQWVRLASTPTSKQMNRMDTSQGSSISNLSEGTTVSKSAVTGPPPLKAAPKIPLPPGGRYVDPREAKENQLRQFIRQQLDQEQQHQREIQAQLQQEQEQQRLLLRQQQQQLHGIVDMNQVMLANPGAALTAGDKDGLIDDHKLAAAGGGANSQERLPLFSQYLVPHHDSSLLAPYPGQVTENSQPLPYSEYHSTPGSDVSLARLSQMNMLSQMQSAGPLTSPDQTPQRPGPAKQLHTNLAPYEAQNQTSNLHQIDIAPPPLPLPFKNEEENGKYNPFSSNPNPSPFHAVKKGGLPNESLGPSSQQTSPTRSGDNLSTSQNVLPYVTLADDEQYEQKLREDFIRKQLQQNPKLQHQLIPPPVVVPAPAPATSFLRRESSRNSLINQGALAESKSGGNPSPASNQIGAIEYQDVSLNSSVMSVSPKDYIRHSVGGESALESNQSPVRTASRGEQALLSINKIVEKRTKRPKSGTHKGISGVDSSAMDSSSSSKMMDISTSSSVSMASQQFPSSQGMASSAASTLVGAIGNNQIPLTTQFNSTRTHLSQQRELTKGPEFTPANQLASVTTGLPQQPAVTNDAINHPSSQTSPQADKKQSDLPGDATDAAASPSSPESSFHAAQDTLTMLAASTAMRQQRLRELATLFSDPSTQQVPTRVSNDTNEVIIATAPEEIKAKEN